MLRGYGVRSVHGRRILYRMSRFGCGDIVIALKNLKKVEAARAFHLGLNTPGGEDL